MHPATPQPPPLAHQHGEEGESGSGGAGVEAVASAAQDNAHVSGEETSSKVLISSLLWALGPIIDIRLFIPAYHRRDFTKQSKIHSNSIKITSYLISFRLLLFLVQAVNSAGRSIIKL